MKAAIFGLITWIFMSMMASGEPPYVVLKESLVVTSKDGWKITLGPGSCLGFDGKNASGTKYRVWIGKFSGEVAWHHASVLEPSEELRSRFKSTHEGILESMHRAELAAVAEAEKREAGRREVDRLLAGIAAAKEAKQRQQLIDELARIRLQLEQLNGRR